MTEAPHLPRGAVPGHRYRLAWILPGRARPVSTTTTWVATTTSRWIARPPRRCGRACPRSATRPGRTAGFHQRAATWLAAKAGLRQFIDIGSGLPTVGNTHQVVQRIDPAARVVYADIDPMVAAQSAPLLAGAPNVTLITADLRDPDALLGHPAVRSMIDFSEPTGLLMTAVLHFVADDAGPWGLLERYVAAVAAGKLPRALARHAGRAPTTGGARHGGDLCGRHRADPPAPPGRGEPVLRRHGDGSALSRGRPTASRSSGSGERWIRHRPTATGRGCCTAG